jgi:integrase/recombinase XerD
MKQIRPNALALLLREFFANHLPNVRGMSPHTIRSYRDSIILLLRFVADQHRRSVSVLDLDDLGPQQIESFLGYLEERRSNTGSTRNIRLSAIHSFFRFVATQHPQKLEQAQRILAIPFKKTRTRVIDYLEYDEIQQILSVIDRATRKGRRDLYAAGNHVQHRRTGAGNS